MTTLAEHIDQYYLDKSSEDLETPFLFEDTGTIFYSIKRDCFTIVYSVELWCTLLKDDSYIRIGNL